MIPDFEQSFSSWEGISNMLKAYGYEEIVRHITQSYHIAREKLENFPMGGYAKGKLSGSYQHVLRDLIKNITRYDKVYEMFSDDKSKEVFVRLVQFRIFPDIQFIRLAYDGKNHQYFDKEIVECNEDEVFVDCGGFIGDTTEDYISVFREYKRIYVYEPSEDNIVRCRENLAKYPDVEVYQYGVGEKNQKLLITNSAASSSFIGNGSQGDFVEIVSLDETIKEPVSFIKMDVEGSEIPAILGAKNHIKNDRPKLAICTYHILSDMWEIPLLIKEICPDYCFYLRHYREDRNWETVFYAIPVKRQRESKKVKKIVALPYQKGWRNVELTKDCGIIPYLFYKEHSLDVTMAGGNVDSYSYLDTFVKGLKMEFLDTGDLTDKLEYIKRNGKKIDCLFLRGAYDINIPVAVLYKYVNPNGIIYLGLDANSIWSDRILWDRAEFVQFMESCDVIATSCRTVQWYLNEKWPWKIEYIPNGYYGYGIKREMPDFSQKEDIILTVSRLGTNQKATEVLMEAFAMAAEELPQWKLRLVGSVEKSFESFIEVFFDRNPKLKSRVEFVGEIKDKKKLYDEYLHAKIFALSSKWEGGTPNVIAEALSAGCVMAVTDIDAGEEMTARGRCGLLSEVGDAEGMARNFVTLGDNPNLRQMSEEAYRYYEQNYDMSRIVSKLKELMFGGSMDE